MIKGRSSAVRGFTLTEVIISATIGTFVMAGVMASFLFMVRSGAAISSYNQMEAEARRAMDEFAQDLRMASQVKWNSGTSITLTIPDKPTITYAFDNNSTGLTAKAFYWVPGDGSAPAKDRKVLARNVERFRYFAFDRKDAELATPDVTPISIKRIQLTMMLRTQQKTTVDQTNVVVSASFILRNKVAE